MFQLQDSQQVQLTANPVSAAGNPAPIDGSPQWSVSDPGKLQLIPDAGALTATARALAIGVTTVTVTADANMGAGADMVSGTLDIEIVAAPAASITITPGVPVLK